MELSRFCGKTKKHNTRLNKEKAGVLELSGRMKLESNRNDKSQEVA